MALVVTLAQSGSATPDQIPLTLTVTNDGKHAEKFCTYHTPFEGVRNDFMTVVDAKGIPVGYAGMMAKRAPPSASDYKTVGAGESKSATFDLRKGYTLPPGHYTVHFTGSAVSGLPASSSISIDVK